MNWNDFASGFMVGTFVAYLRYRLQLYRLWKEVQAMLRSFKYRQDTAIKAVKQQGVDEAIAAGYVVPAPRNQPEETFK